MPGWRGQGVWATPGAGAPSSARLGPLSENQPSPLGQAACLRELGEQVARDNKPEGGVLELGSAEKPSGQHPVSLPQSQWGRISHTNLSDPLRVPRSAVRWPTPPLGVASPPYSCYLLTPLQ